MLSYVRKENQDERGCYLQKRGEKHLTVMTQGHNVWRFVRNTFRPYTTSFRGIKTTNGIEKDPQKIIEQLENYFEHHFSLPIHDLNNAAHTHSITAYE
jgi:hypothetical protein